jgi:hypothetical protein
VVAIVPGTADLGRVPMWFGTPGLPEAVDAAVVRAERSRADAAGIQPVAPERIRAVLRKPLQLADKAALLREAGTLVQLYAPDESERAEILAQKGN